MSGKSTLSEQIYKELFEDITAQRLKCGQKLTLKVLKERFGVSHTPIREALTRLSEDGLATYYSNCGVKVADFTEDDITQLFQFIGKLDAMAISFCKNLSSVTPLIYELNEIIDNSNRLLNENNISGWKKYSEDFHVAFYRWARNSCLDDAARRVRARVELLSCMYYQGENPALIEKQHREIFMEIKKGDFDKAADLMYEHLQHSLVYALNAFRNR